MRSGLRLATASAIIAACTILLPTARAADRASSGSAETASLSPGDPADVTAQATPGSSGLGLSPNPNLNTPGQENVRPVEVPVNLTPPLTGLFPEVGAVLLNNGIDVHGLILDHFLSNPSFGVKPGNTENLGAFRPAMDLDLGKLIGLPGGYVHFANTFFILKSNVSAFGGAQVGGVLAGYQTTSIQESRALTTLSYEQRLLNDQLSFEAGKINVHRYFLLPNGLDPFNYDSRLLYGDGDIAAIPYGLWGGRVNYHFAKDWYVQTGAFEDDYRRAIKNDYNIGDTAASGAQILSEVGQRSEFGNAQYPSNMEVGFEWNTRTGRSNEKATAAPSLPTNTAANYPGGGVFFAQGLKVVWRGPANLDAPPKNISVWGQFDAAVDKPQPFDVDAATGVNFQGLIPGRPLDTFGLQVNYLRLSQIEANFETREQTLADGPGRPQPRDGYSIELVDRVQLNPWASVAALAQYFTAADSYYSSLRPHDGFLLGAYATIALGPLFGTSRLPF